MLEKFRGKIKFLSMHNFVLSEIRSFLSEFCRQFAESVGKSQIPPARRHFLTHDAASQSINQSIISLLRQMSKRICVTIIHTYIAFMFTNI